MPGSGPAERDHLDASFLVRSMIRDTPEDAMFRKWVGGQEGLGVTSIAWAQFLCGPVAAEAVQLVAGLIEEPLAYGVDEASLGARLFNESGRRRGSFADCMIAATALRSEAPLVIPDVGDFRRLEPLGLRLLRPER